MIDVVKEVGAFKPIDLARIPEKYRPATEQMRMAFVQYNMALHEVQIGHNDEAKNYVKKALTLFPDFYEAIMVHGILVFVKGDRTKAVRIFNSVKDLELRAISIETFDRLVKEAERPETLRSGAERRSAYQRGTADSVIARTAVPNVRSDIREARYSKGRVFERSSGYYEAQTARSGARPERYDSGRRKNIAGSEHAAGGRSMYNSGSGNRNDARNAKDDAKNADDFRLLNKYLLIIVALLLIFSIVVSTVLINKMASERNLREQLNQMSASEMQDTGADS